MDGLFFNCKLQMYSIKVRQVSCLSDWFYRFMLKYIINKETTITQKL